MKRRLSLLPMIVGLLFTQNIFSQTYYGDTLWTRDYSSTAANSSAFSPDGSKLAVSYDCMGPMVRVLDANNGSILWQSATPDLCLFGIQFSSNGQYIAIAEELGHLTVIDITIPDTIYDIDTHSGGLSAVDFSSFGDSIYVSGADGTVRIFETSTGVFVDGIIAHNQSVTTLDVSPNGNYLATGSADNTIKIFDLTNNYQLMYTFTDHTDDIKVVKFTPDEIRLLSGAADDKVNAYWIPTGSLDTTLSFHHANVNTIDISADGSFAVSGSDDQSAWMFNLNNYDSTSIFTNLLQTRVNGVSINPQMNKMTAVNHIGGIIMYDITSLTSIEEVVNNPLIIYPNPATDIIYMPNLLEAVHFEILNLSGQVVQNGITSNAIDISSLTKGIYVVHVGTHFAKVIKH